MGVKTPKPPNIISMLGDEGVLIIDPEGVTSIIGPIIDIMRLVNPHLRIIDPTILMPLIYTHFRENWITDMYQ